MGNLKWVLGLMIVCIQAMAFNDDTIIVLTRTHTQILIDNNKTIITNQFNGDVEISFLQSHQFSGQKPSFKQLQQTDKNKSLVNKLDMTWDSKQLQHMLKLIKSNHHNPLFYSSENDLIEIEIIENGQSIWQISFNNLHELQYFYDDLGAWQSLIDLVVGLESLALEYVRIKRTEVK